jgi:DNA-binding protein H-NS
VPNREPVLATIISEELVELSTAEVRALNEFLDNVIRKIDENNKLYDKYMNDIIKVQEGADKVSEAWTNMRKKRAEARKVKKKIKKVKKTQSAADKLNTIAAALNPVAAALQFAAKILVTELQFELDHLAAIEKVVEPSRDTFIRFSGGFLSDGTDVRETADLPRKIRELEERIRNRKLLREAKRAKLKQRKQDRKESYNKAMEDIKKHNEEAEEHNKNFDAEQAAAQLGATAQVPAAGDGGEVIDLRGQEDSLGFGDGELPVTPDSSDEEQTVYLEGTETGVPQGIQNAGADADQSANPDDTGGLSEDELEVFDAASNLNDEEFEEWLESEGLEE